VIIQTTGTINFGTNRRSRIKVRGHLGWAAKNVITWRENGVNDYISAGVGGFALAEPQMLTTRQLIAIS
jgi:hypothetical protein